MVWLDEDDDDKGALISSLTLRCTGVLDADVALRLFGGVGTTVGEAGGFAPPIRKLPRGQLVPSNWESNSVVPAEEDRRRSGFVAFRYYRVDRSGGGMMTPVYLALQSSFGDDNEEMGGIVHVSFGTMEQISNGRDNAMSEVATSGGGKEGGGEKGTIGRKSMSVMTFPLWRHINLDGFKAVKAKARGRVESAVSVYGRVFR